MDENAIRGSWKTTSKCQIFSNSKKKWFQGEVASIFTDEEGEWLEVRYDKSMSKQVQRYSSDIRPHPDDLKKKKHKKQKPNPDLPFPPSEMSLRQSWDKGDEVEIFSNTHQEWYLGEVVDIIKDDEGEWLNCVWARANGEAMSKQVQRFSTDVRPVQDDNSTSSSDDGSSPTNKSLDPAQEIIHLAKKIQARKNGFKRAAPPFSRTLRPSTFTYPATSSARRSKKLLDLEETAEKHQHVVDLMPSIKQAKKGQSRYRFENMRGPQVRDFIRSLGTAYERYGNKFRNINGAKLITFEEHKLQKMGVQHKLHRNKILLEIAKNSLDNNLFEHDIDVLNWTPMKVKQWCMQNSVISIYANKFCNHGVDGNLLFDLDHKDLNTIGVKKMHQQKVLEIIDKLHQREFAMSSEESKENNNHAEQKNNNNNNKQLKKRGSVMLDEKDLAKIHPSPIQIHKVNSNNSNDAMIYTMGQLLLELGNMFSLNNIPSLTNTLEKQMKELKSKMNNERNLGIHNTSIDGDNNGILMGNGENSPNNDYIDKLNADSANTSPIGLENTTAWIATQKQAKGHKRRGSLPYLNTKIEHNEVDSDDDIDDISDIE